MSKNILYFVVAVTVFIVVGAVVVYFTQQRSQQQVETSPESISTQKEESGLGGDLYQNPASEVPETNPFQTKTNPFGGYKNPFE